MAARASNETLQDAVNAVAQHGSISAAARALKVNLVTFQSRLKAAHSRSIEPTVEHADSPLVLKEKVKRLEAQLKLADQRTSSIEIIKLVVGRIKRNVEEFEAPSWISTLRNKETSPGVPTLFLSDLHWGEVVRSSQINGVNKYNIAIAHERLNNAVESAIHLLRILSPKLDYPGIVMPLGGDMISGNIHEELTASNEINSMPAVLDLFGELCGAIKRVADVFGKVLLPCVTGNHGRDTMKIWNKDRQHTSFDWLLFKFLAKHFENDSRVTFFIPDGPDAYYRIYGHRYLLTHGDQFRGGDGLIGCLGPIIRGDHKKRSRNGQIDMDYDTMLLGHWHQYIHHSRVIVNGSLKGYDEYAYNNNFGFESPQQALWITHPKYGITFRMPVYVDRVREPIKTTWAAIAA